MGSKLIIHRTFGWPVSLPDNLAFYKASGENRIWQPDVRPRMQLGLFFIRAQKLQFLVIENVTIQLFRYEKII